jgi:hypothetical protein
VSFRHAARACIVSSLTLLAACHPYPDEPQVVGGYVTLKPTATSRRRRRAPASPAATGDAFPPS